MKLHFSVFILSFVISQAVFSQSVGASFGAFFPLKGSYTNTVAPLAFDDIGFNLGKYVKITSGYSMLHFGTTGISDLPFDAGRHVISRNFANFIPLRLSVIIPVGVMEYIPFGGFFFANSFSNRIDHGVFDNNLRDYLGYEFLHATSQIDNKFTRGLNFGLETLYHINDKIAILLMIEYLDGGTRMDLSGDYFAYNSIDNTREENTFQFNDAKIDFTGFGIHIGGQFKIK